MALPLTPLGFAFQQPASDQPPLPYIVTGALGTGVFVVTGNALTAPKISTTAVQKGTFTITGKTLAAPSISGQLQRGTFSIVGKTLVGPSLSGGLQGGAFIITGYPLGGGVVPPGPKSTGAGWRRRRRRAEIVIPSVPTPTAMKAVQIVEEAAREYDARDQLEQILMLYMLSDDEGE